MGSRIGLLMVGHVDPKSVHIAGDYPELFADLLAGHDLELVRYDLDEGRFPDSPAECDGWMCGPSRASAYDPLPWRADAEELLRRIVATERPYVGICFGHQLLAQAHGSTVERAADGWQVGVREYEIVDREPWMGSTGDPAPTISLIASHQDQVMNLPDGATLLARAADGGCPIAGFTLGPRGRCNHTPSSSRHSLTTFSPVASSSSVPNAWRRPARRFPVPPVAVLIADWIAHFFSAATWSQP